MRPTKLLQFIVLCLFINPALADINTHFSSIKSDPNALYNFLKDMPKGGELHYHLSGGAYPETMLSLAAQSNFCLDNKTSTLSKITEPCKDTHATELVVKPALYDKTIRAWSMKDFIPGKESGHDHFFASFFKFMPVVSDFRPQLLADVMQRAAKQHELYMEIMVLPDNAQSTSFAQLAQRTKSFANKKKALLANKQFRQNIHHTIDESSHILQQTHKVLGCDTKPQQSVCALTVKFQYYVLREQPLDSFFSQALNGFAAAAKSKDIVAVNIVQAEDGPISLRDYRAQMRVIKFMHEAYPQVHISLHAGELSPKIAPAEDMRYHIHDAVFTGHAERIGHGVDITHEDHAEALLRHMATSSIAVEVNLTSNHKILDIAGDKHPLNNYLAHRVPVVLSTDDEGILRTDLTHQYVDAVRKHGLDYPTIKTINRNALSYSFMPGKSLWADASKQIPVQECLNLNSDSCQQFIDQNDKAKLQWKLEVNLAAFEQRFKG